MIPGLYLFLHVLGIILWVGAAVSLPFVTGRAARQDDLEVRAFAYRASARVMRTVGLAGMVLTVGGGIALTVALGYAFFRPFPDHWLFQMQILGILAFLVGALYQIPLGNRLAREAEASAASGEATRGYEKYRRRHAIVGSINGLILLIVVILGTVKPGG